VLINLGDWYTNGPEPDFPRSEACLREAISIARRLGVSEWTSVALSELTTVLRREGRLSEADTCIQEAFALAKETQRARCMCAALGEMGNLALIYGNLDSALLRFQEMYCLCPQGDSEMQALSMFGLARTYEQLGQWDQARSFGKKSLALLLQKNQIRHIERVQMWYTNLVQRSGSHVQDSPSIETCILCGKPLERASGSGRTRRYCSDRCRKRAQRERGTGGDVTK
jgi:tetratricopeptide (TPR) repeat protein